MPVITTLSAAKTATLPVAKFGAAARRATTAFTTAAKSAAAFTARGAPFARLVAEAALGLDAFVAGELFEAVGLGLPLRPRGLEEVFQVEIEIGGGTHENEIGKFAVYFSAAGAAARLAWMASTIFLASSGFSTRAFLAASLP